MKKVVLGNEALAQGAIDSGISGIYAYPGTPSTEITEYVQHSPIARELGIHSEWSVNEKTAMEAALGMSYAGKRSMVVMKHVGLNVASDVFMNMAISGINGGLVVVVADDPSMHSSQNEQDSRFYGKFAKIPILEPSNQQDAYNMMHYAFELSEESRLPVLLRLVTRLSHSRSTVIFKERRAQNGIQLPVNTQRFALVPGHARIQYESLVNKRPLLIDFSEKYHGNRLELGKKGARGIVACGIAYNYLMENIADEDHEFSILKMCQYPAPKTKLKQLFNHCSEVLVIEEGYPMIEELLNDYFDEDPKVKGKLSGHLPLTGELNPDLIASALGFAKITTDELSSLLVNRPPQLCEGCGHTDLFNVIQKISTEQGGKKVFGDIGCYALGAIGPENTINTLIDMGASITMAKGAADAGLENPIAIIGDSTFTHSGMTGLLEAVIEDSPITVIISDNASVAMTGAQESLAVGRLESICIGLGVDPNHLKVITPLHKNFDKNLKLIRDEISHQGLSVIISRRPCVRLSRTQKENIKHKIETINPPVIL